MTQVVTAELKPESMYLSFQSMISFVPFTFQNIFYLCVFKPTSKTSHLITFHIVFNIAIITYCFYLIPLLCLLFHTDTGHLRSCGYAFYKFFQLNDEFCLGHDQMQNPMTSSHGAQGTFQNRNLAGPDITHYCHLVAMTADSRGILNISNTGY